jgi:hypothetical protein
MIDDRSIMEQAHEI